MAKKPAPVKAKAKTPVKAAPKKAASAPVKAAGKKAAVKKAAPAKSETKHASAKPSLKSAPKKDVKSSAEKPAMAKAGAAKLDTSAKSAKAANIAAAKAAAASSKSTPLVPAKPLTKPLTKAPKVAKGKGGKAARALLPKNYDDMCREMGCESHCSTAGYCRLHYIKNWKKIKRKELILREKKLNQYIEELVSKYPDKYIEAIKQDLTDEKAFSKVIYDLELDENVEDAPSEDEADESIIDNIKRDFDDSDTDF